MSRNNKVGERLGQARPEHAGLNQKAPRSGKTTGQGPTLGLFGSILLVPTLLRPCIGRLPSSRLRPYLERNPSLNSARYYVCTRLSNVCMEGVLNLSDNNLFEKQVWGLAERLSGASTD